MNNFVLYNPTKVLFGKDMCSKISALIDPKARILLAYGGGSIKKNGVYGQIKSALKGRKIVEFSGIEANPEFETCLKAVKLIKKEKLNYIIAAGGGSVIDAVKFISAAVKFKGDPWDILSKGAKIEDALPFATVLTLPATGSEMNMNSVISRREISQKLAFASAKVFPQFSVLDPSFTFSLPARQISNGVVDAFIHVLEQYLTYPAAAPLQDRFAESIMLTLYQEGPKALKNPLCYDTRANLMLCATFALNHMIASGVPQDWSTHAIGHEITALYGLDHAQTLAIVMPKMMVYKRVQKRQKLIQLGRTVFGIEEKSAKTAVEKTVEAFKNWLKKLSVKYEFADYGICAKDASKRIADNLSRSAQTIGEHADITPKDVEKLLKL